MKNYCDCNTTLLSPFSYTTIVHYKYYNYIVLTLQLLLLLPLLL